MKKTKKTKAGYIKCADCGAEFKLGMPHTMFCPAHTCDECGSSFGSVVQEDPDQPGKRLCENCLEQRINS